MAVREDITIEPKNTLTPLRIGGKKRLSAQNSEAGTQKVEY
jgi:hypothetical protein